MDAFLAAWRGAMVVRRAYGFEVISAFVDLAGSEFTWAVGYNGDFPAAEKAYYASPERAALPANPADHIASVHTAMVSAADPDA